MDRIRLRFLKLVRNGRMSQNEAEEYIDLVNRIECGEIIPHDYLIKLK